MLQPSSKWAAKREKTARRLTRCALELSRDRGFDGWTVDDLAEEAEVSRRTVFNYFDGKADIVVGPPPDVSDEAKERFLDGGPTGDLVPDILVLADEIFEERSADVDTMTLSRSVITHDPHLLAIVHERFETITEQFVDFVQQREGTAYDATRARLLIRLLVTLFDVALERLEADPSRSFSELFAAAVDDARAALND